MRSLSPSGKEPMTTAAEVPSTTPRSYTLPREPVPSGRPASRWRSGGRCVRGDGHPALAGQCGSVAGLETGWRRRRILTDDLGPDASGSSGGQPEAELAERPLVTAPVLSHLDPRARERPGCRRTTRARRRAAVPIRLSISAALADQDSLLRFLLDEDRRRGCTARPGVSRSVSSSTRTAAAYGTSCRVR